MGRRIKAEARVSSYTEKWIAGFLDGRVHTAKVPLRTTAKRYKLRPHADSHHQLINQVLGANSVAFTHTDERIHESELQALQWLCVECTDLSKKLSDQLAITRANFECALLAAKECRELGQFSNPKPK